MLGSIKGLWRKVTLKKARSVGKRFETTDMRKPSQVSATIRRLGKGSIAAVYGPFGTAFCATHVPALREFLGKLMVKLFPQPLVELDAPPCIDVALRSKNGKTLIHLSNTAGMQTDPNRIVIDYVPPAGPITLFVKAQRRPRRVALAPADQPIKKKWADGLLTVTIPKLEIHNVLVVE